MATTGAETNVPLLVASVFAATFLVVGAIAYLLLLRKPSAEADAPASQTPQHDLTAPTDQRALEIAREESPQFTLPLDDPASAQPHASTWESVSVVTETRAPGAADAARPDHNQQMHLRLYRALMFATGIAGLLASALMLSAVEGLSLLPVVALLIAAFSVYSIYRGFVPDQELKTRPPKK